jgi:hypothetical protein
MRTSGLWIHKDKPDKIYVGQYKYLTEPAEGFTSSDRVFILSCPLDKKQISFESWQEASESGWKKIK